MRVVEVTKKAIITESGDFKAMSDMIRTFKDLCYSNATECATCSMIHFCLKHENPIEYLTALRDYLDD